jgi:integrase
MAARTVRTIDEDGRRHGGPIVATREKALLSAVFAFARIRGLTNASNPCAGVRGTKSHRDRYVTDAELSDAIGRADPALAAFLALCYFTGQRPGDVAKMRRQDVQEGALCVRQAKTGSKVRIELVGLLAAIVAGLTDGTVRSMFLIHDRRGQPFTLAALRKRFDNLGCDWQIRDLRAKAASDSTSSRAEQTIWACSGDNADGYIRQRIGALAEPIMRKIADKPS